MPEHGITFDPATAAILARAAELQGVTLSEYVRQAALRQAEMDLTADELTNARLLKLAAARSPPSSWFEENADLFRVDGTK